jgi:hypothetical protein
LHVRVDDGGRLRHSFSLKAILCGERLRVLHLRCALCSYSGVET